MSTETLPQNFNECDGGIMAVINPGASSIAEASATPGERRHMDKELASLVRVHHDRLTIVSTEIKPELTREKILEKLYPGMVIITFGGDGIDNLVGDLLMNDPELDEESRLNAMLSVMAGNANNGASELTPKVSGQRPKILHILDHGQIINTHGSRIEWYSNHPDFEAPKKRSALFDHSVHIGGPVGIALTEAKEKRLRSVPGFRNLVDGRATLKAYRATNPIEMKINGQKAKGVGSIGVSSNVYLKHIITPASVADRAFYELTLGDNTKRALGKTLMQHAVGQLAWRRVEPGEELRYELTALPNEQLYVERDAEYDALPVQEDRETDIVVVIRPQDRPLRMFSNNPKLTNVDRAT